MPSRALFVFAKLLVREVLCQEYMVSVGGDSLAMVHHTTARTRTVHMSKKSLVWFVLELVGWSLIECCARVGVNNKQWMFCMFSLIMSKHIITITAQDHNTSHTARMMTCHTAMISLMAIVAAISIMFTFSPAVVDAAKIVLRPPMNDAALPADWKSVFTMLASVVEDDDFQDSLREYLRASGARANYCRMTCVVCDDNMQVVALNLTDVYGSIAWPSIPKGTSTITVSRSALREPFDLSTLPYWVKVLKIRNVTFTSDGANSPARFRKRHTMLQVFECVSCRLHAIQWSTMPALTHLDLSDNPLTSFDFALLPPTLRYFNMSGCRASMDAVTLQSLPPPLVTLDISHNRLKGSMSTVVFPSSLETLKLANNLIEGDIQMDNYPFTLVECDVSNNSLTGTIGDMSMFLSLQVLKAQHNNITSVAWDKLPTQLELIDVSYNSIRGHLDVSVLPTTLGHLDVSHNQMTGSVVMQNLPPALATLDLSYNKFRGKLDLTKFSDAMRFVYIQNNKFEGNPDVTNLPVNLRRILIYDNDWDSLMPPLYL